MTVADVCAWLATIKLDKYAALFTENDVTGPVLAQIDKASLAALGITNPFEQAKICGNIDSLKAGTRGWLFFVLFPLCSYSPYFRCFLCCRLVHSPGARRN